MWLNVLLLMVWLVNGLIFCVHHQTFQIYFTLLSLPSLRNFFISDLEEDFRVQIGGLGLCNPSSIADFEFDGSVSITLYLYNSGDHSTMHIV